MGYEPKIDEGIKHLLGTANPERVEVIVKAYKRSLIEKGPSHAAMVLPSLESFYVAHALLGWFREGNLEYCKKCAFAAGLSNRMSYHFDPAKQAHAGGHYLLFPLLSDNDDLIHWCAQYVLPLFRPAQKGPACEATNHLEYHSLQFRLALQGEWDLLAERSEYLLANPPKKRILYQIDYKFFLALAHGDIDEMEESLNLLLSPKVAKHRNKAFQFGLTERLISSWGFILAKIAWRSGYEVQVDSPWLPKEWLPIKPLQEYSTSHDFLDERDIFEPFSGKSKPWCPNISACSPRPPDQPMLKFDEVKTYLKDVYK